MCGISACILGEQNIVSSVKIVSELMDRGRDATGVAFVKNGKVFVTKEAVPPDIFLKKYEETLSGITSNMVIAHNRGASRLIDSDKTKDTECHPFLSEDKTFALLHNGGVPNYWNIMNYLKFLGHEFSTGIDSEVQMHMLEDILRVSKNREEAMRRFYQTYCGNILVLFGDNELYGYASNDSFVIVQSDGALYIGSAGEAIFDAIGEKVLGDKVYALRPKVATYIKVTVKDGKYTLKLYSKDAWVKYPLKYKDWTFCKYTKCDYCHTDEVACQSVGINDRCIDCYKKGISEPKSYVNTAVYNANDDESNIPSVGRIVVKQSTPKAKVGGKGEVAICAYCHLPHHMKAIIQCTKCGKYYCMWDLNKHKCHVIPQVNATFLGWIDGLFRKMVDYAVVETEAS